MVTHANDDLISLIMPGGGHFTLTPVEASAASQQSCFGRSASFTDMSTLLHCIVGAHVQSRLAENVQVSDMLWNPVLFLFYRITAESYSPVQTGSGKIKIPGSTFLCPTATLWTKRSSDLFLIWTTPSGAEIRRAASDKGRRGVPCAWWSAGWSWPSGFPWARRSSGASRWHSAILPSAPGLRGTEEPKPAAPPTASACGMEGEG